MTQESKVDEIMRLVEDLVDAARTEINPASKATWILRSAVDFLRSAVESLATAANGVTIAGQCLHPRATISLSRTTNQQTHHCPDCGAVWNTWPDASRTESLATPREDRAKLAEEAKRLAERHEVDVRRYCEGNVDRESVDESREALHAAIDRLAASAPREEAQGVGEREALAELVALQDLRNRYMMMQPAFGSERSRLAAEHRARLGPAWAAARAAIASAPQEPASPAEPPPGFALVPIRLTRAMDRVMQQEGWQWADLLAAAEAIDEAQYEEASQEPSSIQPALTDELRRVIREELTRAAAEPLGEPVEWEALDGTARTTDPEKAKNWASAIGVRVVRRAAIESELRRHKGEDRG